MDEHDACFSPPIGQPRHETNAARCDALLARRIEAERDELATANADLRRELMEAHERERQLMLAVMEADALAQRWSVVSTRLRRAMGERRSA